LRSDDGIAKYSTTDCHYDIGTTTLQKKRATKEHLVKTSGVENVNSRRTQQHKAEQTDWTEIGDK